MKKLKKYKNHILAFIVPFILFVIIFYLKGTIQNVENIYVSDLRLQHLVFLNYLKDIMLGKASIAYTFYAGMGSPMISALIFYCISPVNLLLLLIKDIQYAILFIYITKASLAGLTLFILLKSKNLTKPDCLKPILFSTCYALSAFTINYFFCVFWFDVLYLAPLVMLGIEKTIKEEKIKLLYIISLSLAIICNIQMGFGLCVYSVIYYLYSYSIKYNLKNDFNKFKQLTMIFIVSSLCAGAISSGAILGFISEYDNIASARSISVSTVAGTSNISYIMKNLFTVGNLKEDYYNDFEPFTYCGLIVTFFSILYLFNKDVDSKKKKSAIGVILVFIISFYTKFINLFWHLSSPVLLNYRYSIYLGLFLTMLAYECYATKNKLQKKDITTLAVCLVIGLFIIILFSREVYVVWTFVFLILIFVSIIVAKNKKFEILLVIAVFAEIISNGYLSIYTAKQLPYGKYSAYKDLKEVDSYNDFDDNYRIMHNYSYTDCTNDSLLLNNSSSLRYFSSVINGNVANFFERTGSAVGNNNYRLSAYDSPLLLSLMGNKYMYVTTELSNSIYEKLETNAIKSYDYTTKKNETKPIYLYENPYALSLGYIIENDVNFDEEMDLVSYQNEIIKSFTGINKDVMIRLPYNVLENSEDCVNSRYNTCRTYETVNDTNNVNVYFYGLFNEFYVPEATKHYLDVNKPVLLNTLNNRINITLEYMGDLDKEEFNVATYDETALIKSLTKLQKNMLTNIKIDKNVLTAKINSNKSGILFLSIPYDDNFKIYVDGKETEYYSLLDKSFIGLDIDKGKHNIKVEYVDKNLKWYALATILSIILTIVIYITINKKIYKKQEEERIKKEQAEEKRLKKAQKKKEKNKKRK